MLATRWIVLARHLCALALAIARADAAAQLYATPVTNPAAVYEFDGYSVGAPQGRYWFEMRRDRQQALFGKKIDSRTHAFAATATSGQVPEKFASRDDFREYIDKMRSAADGTARKVIAYDSEFDTSFAAWCVKYRLKSEDRGAPYAQGRALLQEDSGIACLHPQSPDLVVDVGYSERGRPGEMSADLRAEGEGFMRSLKLTPLRP